MHAVSTISNQLNNKKPEHPNPSYNKRSSFFRPFIQARLTINQPNDIYEKEADVVAERVMRMSDSKTEPLFFQPKPLPVTPIQRKYIACEHEKPLQRKEAEEEEEPIQLKPAKEFDIQRKRDHCKEEEEEEKKVQMKGERIAREGIIASPAVNDVINSHGQPLDAGTRSFMESKFGYDFANVQVHNDSLAQQSSADINALAYTHGHHIVFGAGQYQPGTSSGKRLLAHELTHVVQQANAGLPGSGSLQCKTGKAWPKFYQPIIDKNKKITQEQRQMAAFFDVLGPLITLCEAVDVQDIAGIDAPLYEFIRSLNFYPPAISGIDAGIFVELAMRLLKLDLTKQSTDLRNSFVYLEGSIVGKKRGTSFLETMVTQAASLTGIKTPDQMRNALVVIVQIFIPLSEKITKLGFEQSEQLGIKPYMDNLVGTFEAVFQMLVDYTLQQFAANTGKGRSAFKMASDILENHLKPALTNPRAEGIDTMKLDVTRTTIYKGKKGKGVLKDWFATGSDAKKRELDVSTYNPEVEEVEELKSSLKDLFMVRRDQLEVINRMYQSTSFSPFSTDRNADVVEEMGGKMRLDSDDDWRKFVLAKYKYMLARGTGLGGKPGILRAIMDILFSYLTAFTQHAHHVNVYDIGKTNYLNRKFPRSLSGRMLHDCGVYAVKAAYILSLVRSELGLRFRFVSLPAHIALLIEGDDFPTYIIQNNEYREITARQMASIKADWDEANEGLRTPFKDKKRESDQFIGEVVSQDYIPGVSMPFKFDEVPKPTENAKKDQAILWDFYQKIGNKDLFGKSATEADNPNHLFELHYLEFTKQYKDLHNNILLPYWNVGAPATWKKFTKQVLAASGRMIAATNALKLVKEFKKEHDIISKGVLDAYRDLQQYKNNISEDLGADPGLSLPGVSTEDLTRSLAIDISVEPVQAFVKRIDAKIRILEELVRDKSGPLQVEGVIIKLEPFFLTPKEPLE